MNKKINKKISNKITYSLLGLSLVSLLSVSIASPFIALQKHTYNVNSNIVSEIKLSERGKKFFKDTRGRISEMQESLITFKQDGGNYVDFFDVYNRNGKLLHDRNDETYSPIHSINNITISSPNENDITKFWISVDFSWKKQDIVIPQLLFEGVDIYLNLDYRSVQINAYPRHEAERIINKFLYDHLGNTLTEYWDDPWILMRIIDDFFSVLTQSEKWSFLSAISLVDFKNEPFEIQEFCYLEITNNVLSDSDSRWIFLYFSIIPHFSVLVESENINYDINLYHPSLWE